MRRLVMLALASAVLASCVVAAASTLGGLSAAGLGAGGAPVNACDSNGVTTTYTTTAGKVTSVTVGGLADPGCEGGALVLTLTGSGNTALGAGGPATIGLDSGTTDNTVAVTIGAEPDAAEVTGVHILIEGP